MAAAAIVVGLVVTWILRGAPPGQAAATEDDSDAPRSGYRDRMIAAVVVGLLLISLGGYLVVARGVAISVPAFVLGFGLVVFLIARNRRYRHASPTLRRTIDFSTAFLHASLLAGILIVGNVIAFRYGGEPLDMTREGTFTLSSMTKKQLETLDRPVKFTLLTGRSAEAPPASVTASSSFWKRRRSVSRMESRGWIISTSLTKSRGPMSWSSECPSSSCCTQGAW